MADLNPSLQDVNRILDPGVRYQPSQFGSNFASAFEQSSRRASELSDRKQATDDISSALSGGGKKTVPQLLAEFSSLEPEEMYKKIGSLASIGMSKPGEAIINTLTHIADRKAAIQNQSLERQTALAIARKQAEFNAEAIENGIDLADKESVMAFKAQKNAAKNMSDFISMGKASYRDASAVDIPGDAFNEMGHWKDPTLPIRLLKQAPRSQAIQSLEERAGERALTAEEIARIRSQGTLDATNLRIDAAERVAQENRDLRLELATMSEEGKNARQEATLAAKAAVAEGQVSRETFVNRHLNQLIKTLEGDRSARKLTPEEKTARATAILSKSWEEQIGSKREGAAPVQGNEVRRLLKGGRTAIFDSVTKQFLRYAD